MVRGVTVPGELARGEPEGPDEPGVRRGDVTVDQQRDPARESRLLGGQAGEQVEQGVVAGAVPAEQPVLDGPHPLALAGQFRQPVVELGEVTAGERREVRGVGVEVGDGRAQLAQQADPVEPVEVVAVVAASLPGVAEPG